MWDRLRDFWFPRLLFLATLMCAAGLAGIVCVAPWLSDGESGLLALFADDAIVRRTALASAAGLVVTAFVFFRPGGLGILKLKREKNRVPPPIAGA
jgi:hypothetical protein